MRNKLIVSFIIFSFLSLTFSFVFAMDNTDIANDIRNAVNNAESTVENAAGNVSNASKDATNNVENAANNAANNVENMWNNDNYNNEYSATRTSTSGNNNVLGLSSNTWFWIILAIVAIAIIALIYFTSNKQKSNYYDD